MTLGDPLCSPSCAPISLYNLFEDFSNHNIGYLIADYHLLYAGQYG